MFLVCHAYFTSQRSSGIKSEQKRFLCENIGPDVKVLVPDVKVLVKDVKVLVPDVEVLVPGCVKLCPEMVPEN